MSNFKHGDARKGAVTRLHNIWRKLHVRTNAKGGPYFVYYANRGIRVAPIWGEFEPFREWSRSNGYDDNLTLERIDNDGDYGPENCRWATRKDQARNRRTSRYITAFGKTLILAEWSEVYNIGAPTIHRRLRVGWTPEDAVSKPVKAAGAKND